MKALIQERLEKAFQPTELIIIDESHKHIGHVGAQNGAGHFAVTIITEQFKDLPLIQRHRLIFEELKDLIPHKIHALRIKT